MMDPSRTAAQFEKLLSMKKYVGKKKRIFENDKAYK